MNSRIAAFLLLAGCRDPYHCASDDEKFDPEVEFGDTLSEAPSGEEAMDMVCAGGLTVSEWNEIAETSPGYDPVVAVCGVNWCVDEFVSRSVCVLRGTVEEWRDRDCPGCRIGYADDFSYPTITVECM